MTTSVVSANTQTIQTPSGRIAYTEQGTGPVALFVHGVLLNKHLWRHQLAHLSDIRRCIAVDLLRTARRTSRAVRTCPSRQTQRCSSSFSMG
jgi:pimeloyl-ACP methyl ester carboxylesterase